MGEWIRLTASDGHTFDAWKAVPEGTPKGAVVVIMEIFGVNAHIREVAEGYAKDGYLAIAPAIYDRLEPRLECGYTPDEIAKARGWKEACDMDQVIMDVDATVTEASKAGKVGMVGYCWGGSIVFVSCCRLGGKVSAGSGYYGGQIMPHLGETVNAPVMLHFGENDGGIPLTDVDKIREAKPEVEIFVYEGTGHGFNCDHRPGFDEGHAATARARTLAHFASHVG
jgi:carboxymethylenebutenolidase